MIDISSPDFEAFLDKKLQERLKPIEDKIDSYKLSILKETLVTKDEFKEEMQKIWQNMDKQREEISKIWAELQKGHEESSKIWAELQKGHEESSKIWVELQKQREEVSKIWVELQKQREENAYNFKKLDLSILDLQNKSGPALERLVLDLMRETLKIEKIDTNKIRREFIVDRNGDIFKKNESVDIDILMENGNVYLIEVKATADRWDAWRLILTGRLYEKINNRPPTQLILIAFRMKQEYIEDAKQNNIRVIVGEVL